MHVVRVCAFFSSLVVHLKKCAGAYSYTETERERERQRDVYQVILQCSNCIGGWGKSLAWKSIPVMVCANARA